MKAADHENTVHEYGLLELLPHPSHVEYHELERELKRRFVKKQKTERYIHGKSCIKGLGIFRPGNFSQWSIKYDGINVQMIRVGQFIYFLTANGMVLHLVLPVNKFGYKAWPEGESVRAELTYSRKSDSNYECFSATMKMFLTRHPLPYTDLYDLSRKMPEFRRMDDTPQWEAPGDNPRIHMHVFGLGFRDNRIPDDNINDMIRKGGPSITAVQWTDVTCPHTLTSEMSRVWNEGGEGLILRTVSTPVDDSGSRPSSPYAGADAEAHCPEEKVYYTKCKLVYQGSGTVTNGYRKPNGLFINEVRVQRGPHIGGGVLKIGLGYTKTWRQGDEVPFYVIPRSSGDDTPRHIVGLSQQREQDSSPPQHAQCPHRRPRLASEGPETDAWQLDLMSNDEPHCSRYAEAGPRTSKRAREDASVCDALPGPAPKAQAAGYCSLYAKRLLPKKFAGKLEGTCPLCDERVWSNCLKGKNPDGSVVHLRCIQPEGERGVVRCGCGKCNKITKFTAEQHAFLSRPSDAWLAAEILRETARQLAPQAAAAQVTSHVATDDLGGISDDDAMEQTAAVSPGCPAGKPTGDEPDVVVISDSDEERDVNPQADEEPEEELTLKGRCPKCLVDIWSNCSRIQNTEGVYYHSRCWNNALFHILPYPCKCTLCKSA